MISCMELHILDYACTYVYMYILALVLICKPTDMLWQISWIVFSFFVYKRNVENYFYEILLLNEILVKNTKIFHLKIYYMKISNMKKPIYGIAI